MFLYTLGEALRKGTLIFYFLVATVILVVFGLAIGHLPNDASIITIFGHPVADNSANSEVVVKILLGQLHSSSVFWIILFGTFGVAGLIPSMLEKGTIDLLLSKPLHRLELLLGRSLGAVGGVATNLFYFFAGVWLILGFKGGVWVWGFLSSMLYVIVAFACLSSIVVLVGLLSRSTALSVLTAFFVMVISTLLESRTALLFLLSDNTVYHAILNGLYYAVPQVPAMIQNSALLIGGLPGRSTTFNIYPFVYSLSSAAVIYGIAGWYFLKKDF
jgi:ABC-type transport system involved in multi-copper enzyme maturation permease subunit